MSFSSFTCSHLAEFARMAMLAVICAYDLVSALCCPYPTRTVQLARHRNHKPISAGLGSIPKKAWPTKPSPKRVGQPKMGENNYRMLVPQSKLSSEQRIPFTSKHPQATQLIANKNNPARTAFWDSWDLGQGKKQVGCVLELSGEWTTWTLKLPTKKDSPTIVFGLYPRVPFFDNPQAKLKPSVG